MVRNDCIRVSKCSACDWWCQKACALFGLSSLWIPVPNLCVACRNTLHKAENCITCAELMMKKLELTAESTYFPVSVLWLVMLVSWLRYAAEILTNLMHFARAALSLMTGPSLLQFSLPSHGFSVPSEEEYFLCRNHKEFLCGFLFQRELKAS